METHLGTEEAKSMSAFLQMEFMKHELPCRYADGQIFYLKLFMTRLEYLYEVFQFIQRFKAIFQLHAGHVYYICHTIRQMQSTYEIEVLRSWYGTARNSHTEQTSPMKNKWILPIQLTESVNVSRHRELQTLSCWDPLILIAVKLFGPLSETGNCPGHVQDDYKLWVTIWICFAVKWNMNRMS